MPRDIQDFVGVNPEVGHACMAGVNYPAELGLAAALGSLFHVLLNGAPEYPMLDVDGAFGDFNMELALETVYTLKEIGWGGVVGIDVQPLFTDREDQQAVTVERSIRNLRRCLVASEQIDKPVLDALRTQGDMAGIAELSPQP